MSEPTASPQTTHSNVDQGFCALRQPLVVLAQPPVLREPRKGPLHDPPLRQERPWTLRLCLQLLPIDPQPLFGQLPNPPPRGPTSAGVARFRPSNPPPPAPNPRHCLLPCSPRPGTGGTGAGGDRRRKGPAEELDVFPVHHFRAVDPRLEHESLRVRQ